MNEYYKEIQKQIEVLDKRVEKMEQESDVQTIQFWNLQLQFLDMDFHSLQLIQKGLNGFIPLVFIQTEEHRVKLATKLALHLSGLK